MHGQPACCGAMHVALTTDRWCRREGLMFELSDGQRRPFEFVEFVEFVLPLATTGTVPLSGTALALKLIVVCMRVGRISEVECSMQSLSLQPRLGCEHPRARAVANSALHELVTRMRIANHCLRALTAP